MLNIKFKEDLKNKLLNKNYSILGKQSPHSTIINIENSEILDIFGVNNENIAFFEKNLSIKIFQIGNQLTIRGEKKDINLLRNAITKTINEKNFYKGIDNTNAMQENLKMQILNDRENIKNLNVTKTSKQDVIGKSKMQDTYLEILQKKQIIFSIGPAGTGKTFLAVAAAVSQLLENKFDRIILSRPAVEAGEKLGFLPGDMKEKVDPYLRPLYDSLYDLMPAEVAEKRFNPQRLKLPP